jgi:hypothetical protein
MWLISDIAHEMTYRLKEGNRTKWLFSSKLTVRLESPITPGRNTATPKSTKTAICRA